MREKGEILLLDQKTVLLVGSSECTGGKMKSEAATDATVSEGELEGGCIERVEGVVLLPVHHHRVVAIDDLVGVT